MERLHVGMTYDEMVEVTWENPMGPDENYKKANAHDVLRTKLLPQIYSLGFLNPDVEYLE